MCLIQLIIEMAKWISVAAPGFWFGGEARTKFHTWIPLYSCTAIASPKFRFGRKEFSKNLLINNLWKFWKIYKTICTKNLKNLQNFSKIKCNRVKEIFKKILWRFNKNFKNFKEILRKFKKISNFFCEQFK